jgi:hypothetical protein
MSLQHTIRTITLEINYKLFQKDYQPGTNLVKDENGDPLADSHIILNR